MALTNLYVQTTGNSMNAGTSSSDAADATSTNGSWDVTADRFIAAAGTPFSATQIGDWASIYNDGVTSGAVYVSKVTAVNGGGASIDLSTTLKYGTKPASGGTGKSCKVNGAWADETALVALGATTIPAATKVNWKKGTYTITATRNIQLAGTAVLPLWMSGYDTTPGDLDNDVTNSLTKPALALNSTFQFTFSGAHQTWSAFNITGSRSGTICSVTGANLRMIRCRVDNTSSNAAANALTTTVVSALFAFCWFRCPTTATTTGTVSCAGNQTVCLGCVSEGGGIGAFNAIAGKAVLLFCIALNATGAGVSATTGALQMFYCTVYNPTVDGVKWSGTPGDGAAVIGCLFSNMTNGINNASGGNVDIHRACNDYYSVTNPEVGMGDSPAFFGQTESSAVLTSSTDMTPVSTSNAIGKGFPGVYEGGGALGSQVNTGIDIGAVSRASGGGGVNRALLPSGVSALG